MIREDEAHHRGQPVTKAIHYKGRGPTGAWREGFNIDARGRTTTDSHVHTQMHTRYGSTSRTYTCRHSHVCMYVHRHTHKPMHRYTHVHAAHTHIHRHTNTALHKLTQTRTQVHTNTHTHMHYSNILGHLGLLSSITGTYFF